MKYKICNYSKTIRLMPQNYWVASIVGNKLVFDSWDGATKKLFKERKISKIGIRWFYFRSKVANSCARTNLLIFKQVPKGQIE